MKKLWVSVKRGLIREPKHRIAMGECSWLFMYMLDVADWETGVISDWKDEAVADDMQMPIRTIRDQRRKLEELNYITCEKKQYNQAITVMNWTNPREYTGDVYNPKQSTPRTSPSNNGQSDTQSDTQSSTQDVTPTSYSKTKDQKPDFIDAILESGKKGQLVKDAQIAFESAFGFGTLPWDTKHDWQKFSKWVTTTHQADPKAFADFVEWRNTDGKYKGAMTNTAIRRDPQMFMDTGYPTFLAHTAMYGKKSQPVTTEEGGMYV